MKTAFLNCIHPVIKQYPKDSTFILKAGYGYEDHGVISNGVHINNDIFVIQPAYNYAFMGRRMVHLMICILLIISRLTIVLFPLFTFRLLHEARKYKKAYHQIVPDSLHVRYDDYAFILIEHNDDKATLLSSDEIRKKTISPISPFRKRIKFIPPKIK